MFDLTPETLFTLSKAFLFILACWVLATNLMWLAIKLVKCHAYISTTTNYDGNADVNVRNVAMAFTFIMIYLFIW